MSQVRKDILNGWKEIGGYVCRDRRTVERWEKQRGLPVRRMPGAGRATVYALMSELDEWLENSKADGGGQLEQGSAFDAAPEQSSEFNSIALSAAEGEGRREEAESDQATPEQSGAPSERPAKWIPVSRRRWIAIAAVAASLVCVLALPVSRRDIRPYLEHPNHLEKSSAVPYRSQVTGVDDLYLRGIYSSEQRTPESLERAEQDFQGAIAKDPTYAPAYAALANTYDLLREYYVMPDEEAFPKAKAAAEHAIALDPRLPEAHASLGFIDFFWSWDTVNAEREFRAALALDPASAVAHHWYGSMLTHQGRYNEAMEQLNIAQRLEPTSASILSTRALALGLSGHRGDAVDLLQEVISESPSVSSPHAILATLSKVEPQDFGRYLYEMRRAAELRHSDEMLQVAAAAEPAFHSGGARAMWAAILVTEERLHPGASDRTFLMVEAETALGRNDSAFADLNQLEQRRDPSMMGVILDPTLSPLRRDRRFGQLIASMGIPPLAQ